MMLPQEAILGLAGASALPGLLALAAAGLLWRKIAKRLDALEQSWCARVEAAETAVESMRLAMQEVCRDVDELASAVSASPASARNGLNLSRRSQALRLHRRGETAQQIAATLGVPRQEVDLLVKVHQIVVANV